MGLTAFAGSIPPGTVVYRKRRSEHPVGTILLGARPCAPAESLRTFGIASQSIDGCSKRNVIIGWDEYCGAIPQLSKRAYVRQNKRKSMLRRLQNRQTKGLVLRHAYKHLRLLKRRRQVLLRHGAEKADVPGLELLSIGTKDGPGSRNLDLGSLRRSVDHAQVFGWIPESSRRESSLAVSLGHCRGEPAAAIVDDGNAACEGVTFAQRA